MRRAVVKHRYIKGYQKKTAAVRHAYYIVHRPGKDKEDERLIYDGKRDNIPIKEVREAIRNEDPKQFVVHKLILSPGVQGVDMKDYARSSMEMLASAKGQDLVWFSVDHDNTDHKHSHIIVMGRDQNQNTVHLTKDDYARIRAHGDRYLEKQFGLDRFLDSSLDRILNGDDYRTLNEKVFDMDYRNQFLMSDEDYKRLHSDKAVREQIEFELYEEKLKNRFYEESFERQRNPTGRQANLNMAGRLTPFHERAQLNILKDIFRNAQELNPEHSQEIQEILESFDEASQRLQLENLSRKDIDSEMLLSYVGDTDRIELPVYDTKDVNLDNLDKDKETPEPEPSFKLDDVDTKTDSIEPEKTVEPNQEKAPQPQLDINKTLDEIQYMESKYTEPDHSQVFEDIEHTQAESRELENTAGESPVTSGWYADPSDFAEGGGINVETNTAKENEREQEL